MTPSISSVLVCPSFPTLQVFLESSTGQSRGSCEVIKERNVVVVGVDIYEGVHGILFEKIQGNEKKRGKSTRHEEAPTTHHTRMDMPTSRRSAGTSRQMQMRHRVRRGSRSHEAASLEGERMGMLEGSTACDRLQTGRRQARPMERSRLQGTWTRWNGPSRAFTVPYVTRGPEAARCRPCTRSWHGGERAQYWCDRDSTAVPG